MGKATELSSDKKRGSRTSLTTDQVRKYKKERLATFKRRGMKKKIRQEKGEEKTKNLNGMAAFRATLGIIRKRKTGAKAEVKNDQRVEWGKKLEAKC